MNIFIKLIIILAIPLVTGCSSLAKYYANELAQSKNNIKNEVVIGHSKNKNIFKKNENLCPVNDEMLRVFNETETTAFLILKNNELVCEIYDKNNTSASLQNSWSIAKAMLSALVGIALAENKFDSIDDSISKYIPEIQANKEYEGITIRNLLEMRSGLDFVENYFSINSDISKLISEKHIISYIQNSKFKKREQINFEYQSYNYQLLSIALENATKKTIPQYMQEKLWERIGAEYDATWLSDDTNQRTKSFCCIKASAVDFMKFANLYLHDGELNGDVVIFKNWIVESAQKVSVKNKYKYSMGWWHYNAIPKNSEEILMDDSYYAQGILGQYMYISKKNNLAILRLGKAHGDFNWVKYFSSLDR